MVPYGQIEFVATVLVLLGFGGAAFGVALWWARGPGRRGDATWLLLAFCALGCALGGAVIPAVVAPHPAVEQAEQVVESTPAVLPTAWPSPGPQCVQFVWLADRWTCVSQEQAG